jgi:hypothetical protein
MGAFQEYDAIESQLASFVSDPSQPRDSLSSIVTAVIENAPVTLLSDHSLDLTATVFALSDASPNYVEDACRLLIHLCQNVPVRDMSMEILFRMGQYKADPAVSLPLLQCASLVLTRATKKQTSVFSDYCGQLEELALFTVPQPESMHEEEHHEQEASPNSLLHVKMPAEKDSIPETPRLGLQYLPTIVNVISSLADAQYDALRLRLCLLRCVAALHDFAVPSLDLLEKVFALFCRLASMSSLHSHLLELSQRNVKRESDVLGPYGTEELAGLSVFLHAALCDGALGFPQVYSPGYWAPHVIPFVSSTFKFTSASFAPLHAVDILHFATVQSERYSICYLPLIDDKQLMEVVQPLATFMVQCPVRPQRMNALSVLTRLLNSPKEDVLRWSLLRSTIADCPFPVVQSFAVRILKDQLQSTLEHGHASSSSKAEHVQQVCDLVLYILSRAQAAIVDNVEVLNAALNMYYYLLMQDVVATDSEERIRVALKLLHAEIRKQSSALVDSQPRVALELQMLEVALERISDSDSRSVRPKSHVGGHACAGHGCGHADHAHSHAHHK